MACNLYILRYLSLSLPIIINHENGVLNVVHSLLFQIYKTTESSLYWGFWYSAVFGITMCALEPLIKMYYRQVCETATHNFRNIVTTFNMLNINNPRSGSVLTKETLEKIAPVKCFGLPTAH